MKTVKPCLTSSSSSSSLFIYTNCQTTQQEQDNATGGTQQEEARVTVEGGDGDDIESTRVQPTETKETSKQVFTVYHLQTSCSPFLILVTDN